jgi:hypothetical protein
MFAQQQWPSDIAKAKLGMCKHAHVCSAVFARSWSFSQQTPHVAQVMLLTNHLLEWVKEGIFNLLKKVVCQIEDL